MENSIGAKDLQYSSDFEFFTRWFQHCWTCTATTNPKRISFTLFYRWKKREKWNDNKIMRYAHSNEKKKKKNSKSKWTILCQIIESYMIFSFKPFSPFYRKLFFHQQSTIQYHRENRNVKDTHKKAKIIIIKRIEKLVRHVYVLCRSKLNGKYV